MVKKIALLGSTGSIGRQALEVIEELGPGYRVVALAAGSNDRLLAEQIRRFRPELAALNDHEAAARLTGPVKGIPCKIEAGKEGQIKAATWETADLVVMAQVGF